MFTYWFTRLALVSVPCRVYSCRCITVYVFCQVSVALLLCAGVLIVTMRAFLSGLPLEPSWWQFDNVLVALRDFGFLFL